MVYSVSSFDQNLATLAACHTFRDILPICMPLRDWMNRFLFAVSGAEYSLFQFQPQISFSEIAAINLPARVVWINEDYIHIEGKMKPDRDVVLAVRGPLAEKLGVPLLRVRVEAHRKRNLMYRFSDALTGRWSVPMEKQLEVQEKIKLLRGSYPGKRLKVFLAVQNTDVRQELIDKLVPIRFLVHAALRKKSMITEPKFFTPDVVIIEESLCIEDNQSRYREMLRNIPEHTSIVVLGRSEALEKIENLDPGRNVQALQEIPENLVEMLSHSSFRRGPQDKMFEANAIYLTQTSPLANCELRIPARLRQVHPHTMSFEVPYKIGDFALCRLESTFTNHVLKQSPYLKIVKSTERPGVEDGGFLHRCDAILSSVIQKDRESMSNALVKIVKVLLKQSFKLSRDENKDSSTTVKNFPYLKALQEEQSLEVSNPVHRERSSSVQHVSSSTHEVSAGHESERKMIAQSQTIEDDMEWIAQGETKNLEQDSQIAFEVPEEETFLEAFIDIVTDKSFRNVLIFLAFGAFFFSVVWFGVKYANEDWGKNDGRIYMESLRRYAPSAFEKAKNQRNPFKD